MMTITDMARLGGKARAASMTSARRRAIAKKASKAAAIVRHKKYLASKVDGVSSRP